jgi:hypothetical protein
MSSKTKKKTESLPGKQLELLKEYQTVANMNLNKLTGAELVELVKKYADFPDSYLTTTFTESIYDTDYKSLIQAVERFAASYNAKPEDVSFEYIDRPYEESRDLHMVLKVSLPDNPKQKEGMKKAIFDGARYKAMRLEAEFENYQDLKKRFEQS